MKVRVFILILIFLSIQSEFDTWSSAAILVFCFFLFDFIKALGNKIPFREFILLLYSLNYLLAPAVIKKYSGFVNLYFQSIELSNAEYFGMAIPAVIALYFGLHTLKTKIFTTDLTTSKIDLVLNIDILMTVTIIGVFFSAIQSFFTDALGYVIYLLGLLRFVGIFGLFILNKKKYVIVIVLVFLFSLLNALSSAMFGEFIQWAAFFLFLVFYKFKISSVLKYILVLCSFYFLTFFQSVKGDYRDGLTSGEKAGRLESLNEISQSKKGSLFEIQNIVNSLERFNQGWIFSKAVVNTNLNNNYQGFSLIRLYFESALLPRFLSPNKLNAGDQAHFTKYTDYYLQGKTAMGLGIFADGYISFGYFGVLIFSYFLGLIIGIIFKVIESWIKISPFFLFLLFPTLFYAIRPDCETQTLLGNLFKSICLYSLIVYYYKSKIKKSKKIIDAILYNQRALQTQ